MLKYNMHNIINICVILYIIIVIDWADEAVEKAEILRLIYQGRFLHSNVTLGALGLVPARTTVMHLVPRETLPEPNSQGEQNNRTISGHWLWSSDTSSSNPQSGSGNNSEQDSVLNSQHQNPLDP